MRGAIGEGGIRVPAVTVFGWDDVLCPITHAKLERRREAEVGEAQQVRCGDDKQMHTKRVRGCAQLTIFL